MFLRNRLSLTAVVAVAVLVAMNSAWSQEHDASNDAYTQPGDLQESTIEVQEAIEEQVVAAQEAAQAANAAAADYARQPEKHFNFFHNSPPGSPFPGSSNEIVKAAEKVRDASDETAKAAATRELTTLVEQFFDVDMRQREKELAAVEQRVERLKSQLERRRGKKQEIVDLQVRVSINDADGLGLMSRPPGEIVTDATSLPPRDFYAPIGVPAPSTKSEPVPRPVLIEAPAMPPTSAVPL